MGLLNKILWAFERKYDGYLKENMTGIRKKIFWLFNGKFEGYFVWFDDEIKADEGKIFCWPLCLAQKCSITLKYKDESATIASNALINDQLSYHWYLTNYVSHKNAL